MAHSTLEEIEEQIEFLAERVGTMRRAISVIHSSLVTGSVFERLDGSILIPDSVDTPVIAANAITVTEIDKNAVTTPKIIAGAINAHKLAAQIILGTEIIAGSFADPDYHGVRLDSSGLRLYDGSGNQRGLLSSDGSGWFGSSGGFSWTTAGALSAAGLTVGSDVSPSQRVEINSTGLEMYNSSNQLIWQLTGGSGQKWWNSSGATQRGEINVDGSGWFGVSSTEGLLWDSSGNVTMTGATFRSGGTTAKLIMDSSGIKLINASGVTTGQLDTDGSFWFGGTSYANAKFKLSTASLLVIDASSITTGNLVADRISTGTLNVDNMTVSGTMAAAQISGGTLGGSFSIGANDITVNSTGKIKFGGSGADYLGDNILHFEVGVGETATIELKNSTNPKSELTGSSGTNTSSIFIKANGSSSRYAVAFATGSSSDAGTLAGISAIKSGGSLGSGILIRASGDQEFSVNSGTLALELLRTNRAAQFYGRIYPGTGSATQTSRYIYDDGSRTHFVGATHFPELITVGQASIGGASGDNSTIAATDYLVFRNASGALMYVPAYSAANAWAA